MKTNGQLTQNDKLRVLGVYSYGASFGAAARDWTVSAEGSIPSSSILGWHLQPTILAPPIADDYRQSASSGRGRKDGVSTPTVIFALAPEQSKGENDVPQLPDRMQKVREDSQRPATVSLFPVLQNLFRATQ
jgi:hypothetical protein